MGGAASLPRAVIDFWFLPAEHPGHGAYRAEWFRKDEAFDAAIRQGFGAAVEAALNSPPGAGADEELLARILLLDQFTRNIYRNTPRAFAGDAQALQIAESLVAAGRDKNLTPWQRWFVYLPFEHGESLLDQERSVALFAGLRREMRHKAFDSAYDYALRHRVVIERFGRFPHRNAILGRTSTGDEIEFLKQPGSSF
ncbi:MAG: DUF924 domain-containing protein [Betaproteobacteria bacterium HGW-Betaproteobacteria-11]|nr:MAG: DUF924 domain-containing protein [Betaproteobacteria bacterium HGW-Betaproteobacteria-11]